ncbi:hypothetical protein PR202_ga22680 [Eleusine coracana subsp. coracana]|uniref:F-box domain-containing protein n=1 Tax=Eleusine coracana subsp. coracana TaxID=191504 RepID=A0AAV5D380_ELECO|nr:hypothetical protein PR202_ga22680 [Eleusine coracana subsp. coracana]
MEGAAVSVLPDDVITRILRRLPARSLAVSRHVCKAWQTIIDDQQLLLQLRQLLLHAVGGIFINYIDHDRPHFFTRPTLTPGPRIDGEFLLVECGEEPWEWYRVQDHCNGLVLRSADNFSDDNMYVINPATRKWDHLPPCGDDEWNRRAFIVFDPAVSPHYEVFMEPSEDVMSPPSWTWHVLSSTTMRWGAELHVWLRVRPHPRVTKLSLANDTYYTIIKSPIDLAECNGGVRSFIGKSKDGVYFAALDNKARLRVWTLSESADKRTTEWLLKHQSALNPYAWSMNIRENDDPQQRTYTGPWNMDVCDDRMTNDNAYYDSEYNKEDWDSDEDNILDVPSNEKEEEEEDDNDYFEIVDFLGFHPYKEAIFLEGA